MYSYLVQDAIYIKDEEKNGVATCKVFSCPKCARAVRVAVRPRPTRTMTISVKIDDSIAEQTSTSNDARIYFHTLCTYRGDCAARYNWNPVLLFPLNITHQLSSSTMYNTKPPVFTLAEGKNLILDLIFPLYINIHHELITNPSFRTTNSSSWN
jgi:hypothetical protein